MTTCGLSRVDGPSSVAVAFDSGISLGRFARAMSDAGLMLTMRNGVLSVLERPEAPRETVAPRRRRSKATRPRVKRQTARSDSSAQSSPA